MSTRLLSNATTTFLRLGATFTLGIFTTWYLVGAIGVAGFGLLALATSSTGVTRTLELALRQGLVRELASAIASRETPRIQRSLSAAVHLCRRMLIPVFLIIGALAIFTAVGGFNTPSDQPSFKWALLALILGEGIYAGARVLSAPYLQSLFAAQHVGLDNLLMVVGRITYALSAVLVFGWLLPDRDLVTQFSAYALSRSSLQLLDVGLGIWLAKHLVPGLRLASDVDRSEYLAVRNTVWHSTHVEILLNLCPQFLAILINLFFGLTYNGLWQIVVQLSGYVRMLAEGLLRGIEPLTTHLQTVGRMTAVKDLMARTIRYQLTFSLPGAIMIGVLATPILHLWVGDRLAHDPHLSQAEISLTSALDLAATMTLIMLAVRTLRSAFFGIERTLYGLGEIDSYSWFAKWALLLTVVVSSMLMYLTGSPLGAPWGLLIASGIYSPGVILAAAKKTTSLPLLETLRRSLPRPLLSNLLFGAALLPLVHAVERLSLLELVAIFAGYGLLYTLLALFFIAEPDEKRRLREIGRSAGLRLWGLTSDRPRGR